MGRAVLVLANDQIREKAIAWVRQAKQFSRITFQGPRRSNDQNSLLWVWLTALAEQLEWGGQKWMTDDWKDYFMHSLKREARWMPNEEGGQVPVGMRSSELSIEEMSFMLEIVMEFGARHGVEPPPDPRLAAALEAQARR